MPIVALWNHMAMVHVWIKKSERGGNPIPKILKEVLNEAQLITLEEIEGSGWELEFIRRELFQAVVPVLSHPESGKFGVLEDNGTLNTNSDVRIRE